MSRPTQQPHLTRKRTPSRALVWIIRDGTHRESTGLRCGLDDKQAQRALAEYISGKYQPPTGLGARLLIDEVIAAYLAGHADGSAARDFLLATAKPILEWWSGMRISEVNKTNCRAYVKWRTSQFRKRHPNSKKPPVKVSDQTARHDLKTLRAALNWYKSEHDPQMVVPSVTLPKKAPPRKDYWLSRSEVARRIRCARKSGQTRHVARVLLIGVYSGTRPGAILALRWLPSPAAGWIDLESDTLHRAGTAERESNKRKPPARIHARLLPHLRRWKRLDAAQAITHVVHYSGEPIRKLRRAWVSVGGGKDGAHICRHTAATWLMQSGVDLYEAAGYLGMSPETLWGTYGHHHPSFQQRAATATGRHRARSAS
jgi:integrase